MTRFKASVQYGDWRGSASADDLDRGGIRSLLQKKGLVRDDEFLIAIEYWLGENHPGRPMANPYVNCFMLPVEGYDNAKEALAEPGPVKVRKVQMELDDEEFRWLFKRLAVVLCARDLGLEGRDYEEIEGEP